MLIAASQTGLASSLAGVVLDLVGEVGDQLRITVLARWGPQTGWAWSFYRMPGSQGSGPGLVSVSGVSRQ